MDQDTFVLCIQAPFQMEAFRRLGDGFIGIDATHNTTQYKEMLLFTIMARDNWGHGEKSIIIFSARSAHISNRCSGCLDANDTWNDKYNQILSELGKGSESHGSAHHIYDRLRLGPDHGNQSCLFRDQDTAVSLACATRDKVPFCN